MFHKLSVSHYKLLAHRNDYTNLTKDVANDISIPASLSYKQEQYPLNLMHRGAYTRKLKKKSYRLIFKENAPLENIKELHLNAEYRDISLIRNKLSLDFFSSIGVLSPTSSYATLQLNNEKKGLFLQLESVDDYFLQNRDLPTGSIYYATNHNANFSTMNHSYKKKKESLVAGYRRKCGNSQDDSNLQQLIYNINHFSNYEFEQNIHKQLDVDAYILWLTGIMCTQNDDGFTQNYALYQNEDNRLFEIMPWDYTGTFGRDYAGRKMDFSYVPIKGDNKLTKRLLHSDSFRSLYKKKLKETLNEEFTRSFLQPRIDELYDTIYPFIKKDPYLSDRLYQFEEEWGYIMTFIDKRRNYLLDHLPMI